ncbi:phosphorylase family protein [Loktanella sp. M215]|uniref:phosphorylase family protein n=1 Tax=Loktanella sp. M215 TaxID=2675431 RepID=UPI001F388F47|nr:hypothetical protein [Loktanella sp. M215]MCF7698763.1 hypothetical protein [Loktanella sp. M215]
MTIDRDLSSFDKTQIEDYDVLIVTALDDLEQVAVDLHLTANSARRVPATDAELDIGITRWLLPNARIGMGSGDLKVLTKCLGAAGNANSALEVAQLIYTQPRPKLLIFCGIGGSLNPTKAQLGNVIVSESIHWRGYDKISGKEMSQRMRSKKHLDYPVNDVLLRHLRKYAKDIETGDASKSVVSFDSSSRDFIQKVTAWAQAVTKVDDALRDDLIGFDPSIYFNRKVPIVKFGKIFSWDFVLNQKDVREEIYADDNGYRVVEMESGGISKAAKWATDYFKNTPTVNVVSIRGISDLCNEKVDDFFRDLSADHAASFLVGFLAERYNPDF